MDAETSIALTNPSVVLLGLASFAAIFAASQWWAFSNGAEKLLEADGWKARRSLRFAGTFTALALGLGGFGFLLGRLTGGI